MEELATGELTQWQASEIQCGVRGHHFKAEAANLYQLNYRARLISRILAPLAVFPCYDSGTLYRQAYQIQWQRLFSPQQTFAIFANVAHSRITHSQYAALRLKDAIVDYFRTNFGQRPSVARPDPDVWINLHLEHNQATVHWDTSGGSLHRRGYRQASVAAPMQETLAAAIIRLTEWDGAQPFYDLMCGSGTLLIEAGMHYCQIPAGFLRPRFGFTFLPDFNPTLWKELKSHADHQIRPLPPGLIRGSDNSASAIAATLANLKTFPALKTVQVQPLDFREITKLENTIIVCNPPYGIRLGQKEKLGKLYSELGDFLKQRCQGSTAYIYCGDRELIPLIGLRPAWKKPLHNGALDGRLVKFVLY